MIRFLLLFTFVFVFTACGLFDKSTTAVQEVIVEGAAELDDSVDVTLCSSYDYFTTDAHAVLINRCYSCHSSQAGYPLTDNVSVDFKASLTQLLVDDGGDITQHPLLNKGSGGDGHTGGAVISQLSQDYAVLVNWIQLEKSATCGSE